MRVLITGGGGFLGQGVARALLDRGGLASARDGRLDLTSLTLFDQVFPEKRVHDPRVHYIGGDLLDRDALARSFAGGVDAVFHLASVVSAGAEADFDLGMRVNLDGMRGVLETCRREASPPKVVFTSSVAAFGGDLPEIVTDATAPTPQSSYGTQKVIGELLVGDYTRKGYIDGRTIRLPTIVVRPGKPNKAASGFMSSILREPMKGEAAVCPVSREARMWILSPQRAIDALIRAMQLSSSALGWNRTLNAPGITASVDEALAALTRIAGAEAAARVRFERDESIEKIVLSWPARFETPRAERLGFKRDANIDEIVRAHMEASHGNV